MLLAGAAACVLLGVAIHQLITAPPTGPKIAQFNAAKEEVLQVLPTPGEPNESLPGLALA